MNSKSKNWSEVWTKFKEGDLNAFQDIYDGFLPNLFAYGSKLAPGFELLDDCIQELFLEIYTHRKNLKNPDNLEYYLLTALRRIIFRRIKKENRFIQFQENVTQSFLFSIELENYENEDFRQEKIHSVKMALSGLSASQREIVYLKFYGNLSYQEIGAMLGIRPDSAKKQVYRIIEKLREELGTRMMVFLSMCFRA